jgi:hypothetical protein
VAVVSTATATTGPIPFGTIISYTEYTAAVTVNTTTEATAVTVVTAPAFVANGTDAFFLEFFSPQVANGAAGNTLFVIYDGASSIGGILSQQTQSSVFWPVLLKRRLVPAAGVRTYSIRAYEATAAGTVNAGAGGSGVFFPGYLMITKAA